MTATSPGAARHQSLTLDRTIELDAFEKVASGSWRVEIAPAAIDRIAASHERLMDCIAEDRLVYGLTTGFGPLANRLVAPGEGQRLQRNLINHLASGTGAAFSFRQARAIMLARLSSIAQGWSGASPRVVALVEAVLNAGLAPVIPQQGTVGASGDLTPLSHMALALMGEGAFIEADGRSVSINDAFRRIGQGPLTLESRDGLALVNGTSAMVGVAALNGILASRLALWSERLTVGIGELMQARAEAWHPEFGVARPHPGQIAASDALRRYSKGSSRIDLAAASNRRLAPDRTAVVENIPPQDAYCLRCAPQLVGAARDALSWHDSIVSRELTSASDNPIFPPDGSDAALHGGNFMGQHVAYAADCLSNAVIGLGILAERQIARVTDEKLNHGLPAFLHRGPEGLNSGLMGAQVTASALLAEMRTRAVPASIQSISTNGANQDVVSMGTIAARNTALHLQDLSKILAIAALCVAQGVDILTERGEDASIGPATVELAAWIRGISAPLEEDRPLHKDIAKISSELTHNYFGF